MEQIPKKPLLLISIRNRKTRLRDSDLATERAPGVVADESSSSKVQSGSIDGHPEGVERWWRFREIGTREQALSA